MDKYFTVDICGRKTDLPVLDIGGGINIAFFNLHGAQALTEHCAKHLAEKLPEAEVVLTAESKGLQLAHCVARNLGHEFYAVARKSKKLYMQDGIMSEVQSITTAGTQKLYLSAHDEELLRGKKVAIVDDVISTGGSLLGLEKLVEMSGGTIAYKAFVLAEGKAAEREDVIYLATIPLL
ncbi:MAG: phosphoribosyltransferase family protein [Christensenellales bacterium]